VGEAGGLQLRSRVRREQDPQAGVPGADALAKGCDTLVSIGGVQSNHTRQVAAVAASVCLPCSKALKAKLNQAVLADRVAP
jgi:4-hydroxy-3-methylbut-2-enyl diphosphate reductase IspH